MQKNVKIKDKEKVVISVLAVVCLVFFVLTININAQKQMALAEVGSLKAEMLGMNGLVRKFSRRQTSLKKTSQKLEGLISENVSLREALAKAQLVNQTLKAGLEDAKASLESQVSDR